MNTTDHKVAQVLAFMRPQRAGRLIFKGRGDEALLQLREQIRREQAAHQDMFADAPHYTPGISRAAVQS